MLNSTNFKIVIDSAADLSKEMCKELDVTVVPLSVCIDGKTYKDYPDEREISRTEFYKLLRNKKLGSTSAPNVADFKYTFERILCKGNDILYISLSSELSSTYLNAKIAADQLKPIYQENKIVVCDSLCASLGLGLLVYLTAKKKKLGYSLLEIANFVEKERLHICHWFTVTDLYHLQRGGRIPKFAAVAGTLLNIKPILHMDENGRLVKVYNVRGRKNSIIELSNNFKKSSSISKRQTVFISHGDCEKEANLLKNMIRDELKPEKIYVNTIGPVIGMHSGPDTIALFFVGNKR